MKKTSDCYNLYGNFDNSLYFSNQFNCIPSNLNFYTPLKSSKQNMEATLQLIDYEKFKLVEVFKNWKTTNHQSEENNEQDYPSQIFLQSSLKKLFIEVDINSNELNVHFLYENSDKELEKWIMCTFVKIRSKLGKLKTPTFKVLTNSGGDFFTQEVNINNFEIDINKHYNDDFKEIDAIINEAIRVTTSGSILLHGLPGTGKTSYIKHLLSKHKDVDFIFIQNDLVQKLLKPDFISFLIHNKDAILIIEDAEKVIMSREKNNNSVVSTILQLTDGLFSDYLNIKVICTFNTNIRNIDEALLRKGRMIAFYEFKPLHKDKANALLKSMGGTPQNKDMTLAEIFHAKSKEFKKINKLKTIGFS